MLIELTEQEELATLYSDMHKDAHGFRPRYMPELSVETLRGLIKDIGKEVERTIAYERQQQLDAAVVLEKRISDIINAGADDRATAVRWIMQGEDAEDLDHLCWMVGVEYGYFNKESSR